MHRVVENMRSLILLLNMTALSIAFQCGDYASSNLTNYIQARKAADRMDDEMRKSGYRVFDALMKLETPPSEGDSNGGGTNTMGAYFNIWLNPDTDLYPER